MNFKGMDFSSLPTPFVPLHLSFVISLLPPPPLSFLSFSYFKASNLRQYSKIYIQQIWGKNNSKGNISSKDIQLLSGIH